MRVCAQAYVYGFTDRGTLEVGKKAGTHPTLSIPKSVLRTALASLADANSTVPFTDLNMINLAALQIQDPEHIYDLPTGAPRWNQAVSGYEMTIVSGQVTFINGVHTGALPGKLQRNMYTGAKPGPFADVPVRLCSLSAFYSCLCPPIDRG